MIPLADLLILSLISVLNRCSVPFAVIPLTLFINGGMCQKCIVCLSMCVRVLLRMMYVHSLSVCLSVCLSAVYTTAEALTERTTFTVDTNWQSVYMYTYTPDIPDRGHAHRSAPTRRSRKGTRGRCAYTVNGIFVDRTRSKAMIEKGQFARPYARIDVCSLMVEFRPGGVIVLC